MSIYNDLMIIETAKKIQSELSNLLPSTEAAELNDQITQILADTSLSDPRKAIAVLKVIEQYSKAHERFIELLPDDVQAQAVRFEPVPGENLPVPPGPLYVCPVDPSHYRTVLQFKGEQCPEHEVDLISEDKLKGC